MMPVLLLALKILAGLLLAILLLLAVALLLPLGIAVEYRPGHIEIAAVCGPVRRPLRTYQTPAAKPGGQKKQEAQQSAPTPGMAETNAPPGAGEKPQAGPSKPAPPEEPEYTTPVAPVEETGKKDGKLERVLTLLEEDPAAVAACLWRHVRWLGRHSPFKMRVRHLYVFWTVTCEDAAATAVAFGAAMTALNTVLAAVQQAIPLQGDRLWLEPDFTGMRRAERRISGTVQARAILMLHLLYRVWNDPLLQPQPEPAQAAQSV